MYAASLFLHSWLRWVIILLLALNIFRHLAAFNKPFAGIDKQLGLFLLIAAHSQFLIGLYQWIAGTYGLKAIHNQGMATVMKNGNERFFAIEHITGMLVAIILITIGRSFAKKVISDKKKRTRSLIFYMLAFIIILALIPWPGMGDMARPLFRNL